jgi:8-oxo-dGTP diphosphatase
MPNTTVTRVLLPILLVPIVLVWTYHLAQRRFAEVGEKKRFATLIITGVLVGVWAGCYVIQQLSISDAMLLPIVSVAAAIVLWKRESFFPYRRTCAQCGKPLSLKRFLFHDSNTCETCNPEGGKTP